MKIAVTGSEGFIGSHFVEFKDVIRIDKQRGFDITKAKESIEQVFNHCDRVVHFAAETFVDTSIKDPYSHVKNNIIGTFNVLEGIRKNPHIRKYIHISTDEVYGPRETPALETDILNPGNPYSATKAAADMLAIAYRNTYKIPLIIVRPENNYGTGQGQEKFIPTIIRHAQEGTPLPIYGDGRHKRMWLHVEDTCRAIETLLTKGEDGEIYNIGGSEQWQNINLAKFIYKIMDKQENFEFIPDEQARPGHDRAYNINTNKIRELGWKPQHQIVTTIRHIVESYTQRN